MTKPTYKLFLNVNSETRRLGRDTVMLFMHSDSVERMPCLGSMVREFLGVLASPVGFPCCHAEV